MATATTIMYRYEQNAFTTHTVHYLFIGRVGQRASDTHNAPASLPLNGWEAG